MKMLIQCFKVSWSFGTYLEVSTFETFALQAAGSPCVKEHIMCVCVVRLALRFLTQTSIPRTSPTRSCVLVQEVHGPVT